MTRQDYAGRRVLVAGAGVAGAASARELLAAGATVTVVDGRESDSLGELARAGARVVVCGEQPETALREELSGLLDGVTDAVVSPGFAPSHPMASTLVAAGLDVYSEPELAWRMREPDAAEWLAVTGTNGKTTTVTMLAEILRAEGLRATALGNIGVPLVCATASAADQHDVLAVELSSFQLHWSSRMAPRYGAILNIAADHLDWHGGMERYQSTKARIWRSAALDGVACGNLDDPPVSRALSEVAGRTVGWTLAEPLPGQLGVIDGILVDRAFGGDEPTELIAVDAVRPPGEHNVSNALAAATLARAAGVRAGAVFDGLAGYAPQPHRNALVATVREVRYVDDSKATNPHAALASIMAYPRIVWVAGGQLKGVDIDELVRSIAGRLAGSVLLGVDRGQIAEALARHAPGIPVTEVSRTDDGAMGDVVEAARLMARPGDTVLLAPAAASLDMFSGYTERGQAFARAVERLAAT